MQHITALSLEQNNLVSVDEGAFDSLPKQLHLSLGCNGNLLSVGPAAFPTNLTKLNLRHCKHLVDFSPAAFDNLEGLTHLDVSNNPLVGIEILNFTTAMASLGSLEYLNMQVSNHKSTGFLCHCVSAPRSLYCSASLSALLFLPCVSVSLSAGLCGIILCCCVVLCAQCRSAVQCCCAVC